VSAFEMWVEDVFLVKDRGVVLTGHVENGTPELGTTLRVGELESTCRGIETFGGRKSRGDAVGILLSQDVQLAAAELTVGELLFEVEAPE
jgi:translation elongation factor EF-Tu-like GTPase